jgi:membrane protein YqaA with SNARE-associated domain
MDSPISPCRIVFLAGDGGEGRPIARGRWIRRLYDWVEGFADSRNADLALFLLAFAESSFFPVPPDVLLIALAFARPRRAFRYALICTVGSVLGGAFGYALGRYLLRTAVVDIAGGVGLGGEFARAGVLYREYGVWAVLVAAFTVIPYKVFTILAGLFHLDFWGFMLASIAGRGGRFFAVAAVIRILGPRIRPWVDRYLEWVTLALALLVVGGFLLLGQISPERIEATPGELRDRIVDLGSPDADVRWEARDFLLQRTHEFFGYNPTGPEDERRAAMEKWVGWYEATYPDGPPIDGPTDEGGEGR